MTAVVAIATVAATSRGSVHLPVPTGLEFSWSGAATRPAVPPAAGSMAADLHPTGTEVHPPSGAATPSPSAVQQPAARSATAPAGAATGPGSKSPVGHPGPATSSSAASAAPQERSVPSAASAASTVHNAPPSPAPSPETTAPTQGVPSSPDNHATRTSPAAGGSPSGSPVGHSSDSGSAVSQTGPSGPNGYGGSASSGSTEGNGTADRPATTVAPDYPVVNSQSVSSEQVRRLPVRTGRSAGSSQQDR